MRRTISAATAVGTALLLVTPSATAAAPRPQITDPYGDANAVNDQGFAGGEVGDVTGLPEVDGAADIGAVTLASDRRHLYVTVETKEPLPGKVGVGIDFEFDGEPGGHCMRVRVLYPGSTNSRTEPEAYAWDECAPRPPASAPELTPVEIDGNRLAVTRAAYEALGKGMKLTSPRAHSFLFTTVSPAVAVLWPLVDTTKPGADFTFRN